MKKSTAVINFLVSCAATSLALVLIALIAVNPEYFTDGRFVSYDRESETVTFLGEVTPLPYETVKGVAMYPKRAMSFVRETFLPGVNFD